MNEPREGSERAVSRYTQRQTRFWRASIITLIILLIFNSLMTFVSIRDRAQLHRVTPPSRAVWNARIELLEILIDHARATMSAGEQQTLDDRVRAAQLKEQLEDDR